MQIGIVGLGRMGGNISRRLMQAGHIPAWCSTSMRKRVKALAKDGATPTPPRSRLVKAPHAKTTRRLGHAASRARSPKTTVQQLGGLLDAGDIVIDGGNTFYKDDIRRAEGARRQGHPLCRLRHLRRRVGPRARLLHDDRRRRRRPSITSIRSSPPLRPASATSRARRTARRRDPRAEQGYIHAGPSGAGHFVKMVHNGIEYGLMQAYAEGFDILRNKDSEGSAGRRALRPQHGRHRRGVAARQRHLVVAARSHRRSALAKDPELEILRAMSQDSGEGRWTVEAAIEEAVPADVLSAALFTRFRSRQEHTFAEKMLSAMRFGFGGHIEGAEPASRSRRPTPTAERQADEDEDGTAMDAIARWPTRQPAAAQRS